jgi:hypothetical protein
VFRAADVARERTRARRVAPLSPGACAHRSDCRQHARREIRTAGACRGVAVGAGHGARHAAAEASRRAVARVHGRRDRLSRSGNGHRDVGEHRACGAGARTVHLPADADHRRRCGAAGQPAAVGAAGGLVLSGTLRGRCHPIDGDRPRSRRRGLQRHGAARHRRRRLPRRRADVPLGYAASARHRGVRLAGCRARRVGRRRSGRRRARNRNSSANPSARDATTNTSRPNS